MCFFLFRVFISMAYVLLYKGVVHYMNHRKNKAETFAFLFSILASTIISYPRITLLCAYRAYTRVGLIVKVVGASGIGHMRYQTSLRMRSLCTY